MKILLTGASGFTGKPFAEMARAAGHDVVALTCDLGDKVALRQQVLAAAPHYVVHLAAISFVGHADDNAFYAVNVVGTTNLLEALLTLPQAPRRVLLASSANVYGNCDASPIGESQPPAPMNHYATSKVAMEHMARTFSGRLAIVVARPFNYIGVGQASQFLIPKLVGHFARRAPEIELGNLHVEREFNDIAMVCMAYLRLLKDGQPGETYNVCSGQAYSLQHVIDLLTRITGHDIAVKVNPAFVRSGEVHRLCGDPARLQALAVQAQELSVTRSLEETLRAMLTAVEGAQETRKAEANLSLNS